MDFLSVNSGRWVVLRATCFSLPALPTSVWEPVGGGVGRGDQDGGDQWNLYPVAMATIIKVLTVCVYYVFDCGEQNWPGRVWKETKTNEDSIPVGCVPPASQPYVFQ